MPFSAIAVAAITILAILVLMGSSNLISIFSQKVFAPNCPGGCFSTRTPALSDHISSVNPAVENIKTNKPLISNNNTSTPKTTTTSFSSPPPTPPRAKNNNPSNTNTMINQNTIRSQVGGTEAVAPLSLSTSSINSSSPYTQGPSMSMWSVSLGKSNFQKDGLRLLANLKPFSTIGTPYILDISLNLPNGNLSLIAAQITSAGLQHAVIVPINKTAEGAAGESLYQAELGQIITGNNPFTRQPDIISGGATDLLLFNNSTSDIAFNDDNSATMALAYR
jgi:hypothetical protein